jgi:hypothetical protein
MMSGAVAACGGEPAPAGGPAAPESPINLPRRLQAEFGEFVIVGATTTYARVHWGQNCEFSVSFPDGVDTPAYGLHQVSPADPMTVDGHIGTGLAADPGNGPGQPLGGQVTTTARDLTAAYIRRSFDVSGCGTPVEPDAPDAPAAVTRLEIGASAPFAINGANGTVRVTAVGSWEGQVHPEVHVALQVTVDRGRLDRPGEYVCYRADANPNMAYRDTHPVGDALSAGETREVTVALTPSQTPRTPGALAFVDSCDPASFDRTSHVWVVPETLKPFTM